MTHATLAQSLAAALKSGRAAPAGSLDAHKPTLAEGYEAQAQVVHALGEKVAGWKAGFGPDRRPAAAQILGGVMHKNGAAIALPADRPILLEIEIAFRLGRDLPPRPGHTYDQAEVAQAVDAVLIGAELIAARAGMPSTGAPFPRFVADLQGNAGYVCGDEIRDFRSIDLNSLEVALYVDGERVHAAASGHPQRDPWLPLCMWANNAADKLGGLKAGQVVTTGSCTPPRWIEKPCSVRATAATIGEVTLTFTR